MPTFTFKSPDGQTYKINGPEGATEAEAFKILQSQLGDSTGDSTGVPLSRPGSIPLSASRADSSLAGGPTSDSSAVVDPAEGMNFAEKALVGVGGGMRNAYLGAKNLVGMGSPEEVQERLDWQKNKENLGGWGTAGEVVGELVATAPVGGPVASGAKVLSKALPALKRLGSVGGRVANLGTAGRAAAEGAISAGIVGDAKDQGLMDRLDNVAMGGTVGGLVGGALPMVAGAAKGATKYMTRELGWGEGPTTQRAIRALERTLGKEKLDTISKQIANPVPSRLPRTSAAMSRDPHLGALERGARSRGQADFAPHDEGVARKAWSELQTLTPSADTVDALAPQPGQIMAEGKAVLDKLPLSKGRRDLIAQELLAIRNSNEVIANPALAQEIDIAIRALDNPDATLGVLPQLYWSLGKEAGDSTAIRNVRDLIRRSADDRSGGGFTNIQEGYGGAMEALGQAEAAQGLRQKFMNEGVPLTRRSYGEGANAVPSLEDAPLRRALAAQKAKMNPTEAADVESLANDLAAHEGFKPGVGVGTSSVDMGAGEGLASAALNAGPFWRLRGTLGTALGGLNQKTQAVVDDALLNPDKFLELMARKVREGLPLDNVENALKQAILGVSRSAAVPAEQE